MPTSLNGLCGSELENAWQSALNLALAYESASIQLPPHASKAFDEFMLSLLLDLAPHNYSDEIKRPHPLAAPRTLREAERLMREADGVASVHEIAAAVGVSVRSMQAGFREWKHETPAAFMRRLRLAAAREQLSDPNTQTTVTDVALSSGFLHLSRFAQYYRAAFHEHPSETLRTARRRQFGANHSEFVLPSGVPCFAGHRITLDATPEPGRCLDEPTPVGPR